MSSFTNDINMIDQILDQGITQAFTAIITVVGAFIMMTVLSPILTLLVLGMILFMFVLIRFVGSKSATFYRSRQKSMASINGYVEEMITAQKVVKVFNYEDRAVDAFEERNEKMRIDSTNAQTYGVLLLPVMGNLSYILYALVAIIGSILVMNATITVGNIASFLQYTRIVTRPITMISNQMNMAFAALAGAERVFKIIDLEPEEMAGEVQLVETCDGIQDICWRVPDGEEATMVPVCGDVRFENVDFSYMPGTPILKDISLFAKPGQKIAFVGSTGAGKTTITNLINRFYEIDSGTITLDGIDIRRIDKGDLRSIMSMVLQDVHLFRGTIAENIRYGKLDATDAEIKEAAKIANADYFISQLSDGYDTVIEKTAPTFPKEATASLHHPGRRRRSPRDHSRRSDVLRRYENGTPDRTGHGRADARTNDLHHRPPPVHRSSCRRHPRPRTRSNHRTGKSRRVDGTQGKILSIEYRTGRTELKICAKAQIFLPRRKVSLFLIHEDKTNEIL